MNVIPTHLYPESTDEIIKFVYGNLPPFKIHPDPWKIIQPFTVEPFINHSPFLTYNFNVNGRKNLYFIRIFFSLFF